MITFISSATQTDQQIATTSATQAVEDYVNNLRVGQQRVINDISDRILNPVGICSGLPRRLSLNSVFRRSCAASPTHPYPDRTAHQTSRKCQMLQWLPGIIVSGRIFFFTWSETAYY